MNTLSPTPPSPGFAERLCLALDVPRERYVSEAMRLTLYPQARLLYACGWRRSFGVDAEFLAVVGRLTRRRDFSGEIGEFQQDPRNRDFLRDVLRLRVSVGRLRDLVDDVWEHPASPATVTAEPERT